MRLIVSLLLFTTAVGVVTHVLEAQSPAQTGALGMGFWQNRNGQGIIAGGQATNGVCNVGGWLRKYPPFQDLSATASCSQAGLYVSSVIRSANASGPAMNLMLKAQMLATALDTYFSDPALGGNRIGAPAPIGSTSIDLTRICDGGAVCVDVTSAFGIGPANSASVSYLLLYAASQSNPGGTDWYGNVKDVQEMAKNAFDAVNNQLAFTKPISTGPVPTTGAPVLNPGAISAGTAAAVTVSSFISGGGPEAPTGVSLEEVDAGGNILRTVGPLSDGGVNGDRQAGDRIFSGNFVFNQNPGAVRLRVSATFATLSGPVRSAITPLEILPAEIPVEPRYFPNSLVVTDTSGRQMSCDQVLALIKPGTDVSAITTLAAGIGGTVAGFIPGAQLHIWQIRIGCTSAQGVLNAVNALLSSPLVADAQPNYILQTSGVLPNDADFVPCDPGTKLPDLRICEQGSAAPELMEIRVDRAWAITQGLSTDSDPNTAYPGPAIAIIDSGVDYTHEDLANPGKVIKGKNFVVNCPTVIVGCDTNNDPMDDFGHGTGVAGVAAADGNNAIGIPGVSWASPIIAEKSQNAFGSGSATTVASAIQDALQRGAKIINLSLGFKNPDAVTASAIDAANRAGALVVAGAGNSYCSDRLYPAGFAAQTSFNGTTYNTQVVSVGGLDLDRNLQAGPTMCQDNSGSNFGSWVKLYAPWFAHTTQAHNCTYCFSGRQYSTQEGTSFATPFVSGVAALVWAANPRLSADQVMQTLLSTADNGGNDPQSNRMKIVNALNAVLSAAARHCDTCPDSPEVTVTPSPIFTGPVVTLGIPRSRDELQSRSIHGLSLPLTPIFRPATGPGARPITKPVGYQVWVGYHLSTWDSYNSSGRGLFDSFSISTSVSPYWNLGLQDPLSIFYIASLLPMPPLLPSSGQAHTCESTAFPASGSDPCTFNAGFLFGGQNQGTTLQDIDSSLAGKKYNLPARALIGGSNPPDANTWLNFVLDTASAPDSDKQFPSWGYFVVFDITPLCSGIPNAITGPLQVGSCPPF